MRQILRNNQKILIKIEEGIITKHVIFWYTKRPVSTSTKQTLELLFVKIDWLVNQQPNLKFEQTFLLRIYAAL